MADTVYFVTNRPAFGRGFGPPPGLGSYDALAFGQVSVNASSDPARMGTVAGSPVLAGTDATASGQPGPGLVNFLKQALDAVAQEGRIPLVVVHGYCYSFEEAVVRKADLVSWLERAQTPVALTPILFTWPSISQLTVDNYLGDRGRAHASAFALARFIIALEAAWETMDRPPCLYLAHSMGAWASQNGMAMLASTGHRLPDDLFDQAIVIAGDADINAAEPGQGLDELARISRWLTIGINRADTVVNLDGLDVLHRPRLGSNGPADPARIPRNARVVDYTLAVAAHPEPIPPGETVWNYIGHQYYRTVGRVRDDMALALAGTDPDDVPDRFTSAQMAAAGHPFIQPGRLYVAPYVGGGQAAPQLADAAPERRGN